MEVRLHVVHGKANVKEIVLGHETLIGRGAECNLKIASTQVSRRHCRIQVTEAQVFVTDLGSANGTLLRQAALPANQATPLQPGDEVEIGPLRFSVRFELPMAVPPPRPPSETETIEYFPDERRLEEFREAAAVASAARSLPPAATVRPGDTVMDLNLSPVPRKEPEQEPVDHPVVALDTIDETLLLDESPPVPVPSGDMRPSAVANPKTEEPDEAALREFFSQLQ